VCSFTHFFLRVLLRSCCPSFPFGFPFGFVIFSVQEGVWFFVHRRLVRPVEGSGGRPPEEEEGGGGDEDAEALASGRDDDC
jgi:hypothetical protein